MVDVPVTVMDVIARYLELVDRQLPGLVEGLHLVGSVALDDYQPGRSDIDFVAVTARPVSVAELVPVHEQMTEQVPLPHFDGIYATTAQLAADPSSGAPGPSAHEGRVTDDPSEWQPVTWLTLADHGITVRGRDRTQLTVWSDRSAAGAWCVHNIDVYWRPWIARTAGLADLLDEHAVTASAEADRAANWVVLGLARMHCTVRTGRIVSKTAAGAYAMDTFTGTWRTIVGECLAVRAGAGPTDAPGRRLREALAFATTVADDLAPA